MMRNDPWEIIVQPTKAIPVDVLNYILTLLRETFVEEVDDTLWSDVDWHILIMIEGKLVSHVEIVEREACVDQDVVKLGGIGGVITLPEWRGRGLARAGMRKAQEFMCEELGVEFGLLMCARAMVTYYSKRGWVDVEGPLVYDQPRGKVYFDDAVMVFSCKGRVWPQGTIDLCGFPW